MAKPKPRKSAPSGRRKPKQARAQALVDAVLTATAQLLRAGGPEAATTNRIAERAGVSVGSLYQYFPNKRALFTAVAQRHVELLEREVVALVQRLESRAHDEMVRESIVGMFDVIRVDAPLHAALQRISLWGMCSDVIKDFRVRIEGQLGELLAARAAEYPVEFPDPHLSARVATRALAGILDASILEDPQVVNDHEFIEETVRLIASRFGLGG